MILKNAPFLSTHVYGDTAWVDVLFIPPAQRRRGHGRKIFAAWSEQLPATVEKIRLLAVDLDGGPPHGFWAKMGFEADETDLPDQFAASYMIKRLPDGGGNRLAQAGSTDRACVRCAAVR